VLFGEKDVTGKVPEAFRTSSRVQNEQQLYIRADKNARYGIVAEVVAAARNSGVSSLNLLVQPELEPLGEAEEAEGEKQ
jgi:biopolymer transport protein TolR